MGKVRLLPDELASKIAAGEIVERPASVVKELIENSIDANSTQVVVELRAGGKGLISVSDNGEGMRRDDALLSIERHATSKIRDVRDLFSVRTLGFRGEAIPSIAAVSRLKLTSRTKEEIIGVRISIEGGTLKSVEETGCPQGTTVEVRNIFFNTPARLKFMKSVETELSSILDIVQREALSCPGVGFQVLQQGKTLVQLPPRATVKERLPEIYPNTELFEVEGESEGIRIHGFMCGPEDSRSTTQRLYAYVNGRAVRDRFLTRMMIDSYGRLIDKGKFPQGVLFIEAPVEEVDVNVHPTKSEVRFRRAGMVGELIKSAIMTMLSHAPWIKGYGQTVENAVAGFFEHRAVFGGGAYHSRPDASYYARENDSDEHDAFLKFRPNHNSGMPEGSEPGYPALSHRRPAGFFAELRVLGQLGGLYIVCQSNKGMILIDQHAAHERINYEKLKSAYMKKIGLETQELLIPLTFELSPSEARILSQHREDMESLGIRLEEFGNGSFLVRSVPSILRDGDLGAILKDVAGEIGMFQEEKSLTRRMEHIISTMACHSSVRANDQLNQETMSALLAELDHAEFPHACPHGRPVAAEITFEQLERMFKRS